MILTSELIFVVVSYLKFPDVVSFAFTCSRAYQVLTSLCYLESLSSLIDNFPPPVDFIRGLTTFRYSHFYSYHPRKEQGKRIVAATDICYLRGITFPNKRFIVDLFGRLSFNPGSSPVIGIKQIHVFTDTTSIYRDRIIALDYDGNIIFDEKKFFVGAQKLLNHNSYGVAFIDEDDQCGYVTETGTVTYLAFLPELEDIRIHYCTRVKKYLLSYYLTKSGDLYHQPVKVEKMSIHSWINPLRRQVKKVLWFSKGDLGYLTFGHEIVRCSNIYEKKQEDVVLMEFVKDAARLESDVYVLKHRTIFCLTLYRDIRIIALNDILSEMTRLSVTNMNVHGTVLIQVW